MKPNIKLSTVKKKDDVRFVIQNDSKTKPSQILDQFNEIKDKKINILLTSSLNDQLYSHVENAQPISTQIFQSNNSNTQNNSFKQYITKISPNNQVSSVNKQCVLPITIKNDGSPDKQIIAHLNTKNLVLPTYQLQMKVCEFENCEPQLIFKERN